MFYSKIICFNRCWLAIHRSLMIFVLALIIISFLLILYSKSLSKIILFFFFKHSIKKKELIGDGYQLISQLSLFTQYLVLLQLV